MGGDRFEQKLQKHLARFVLCFLVAFSAAFGVLLLLYSYGYNSFRANSYNTELSQAFAGICRQFNGYLTDEETHRTVIDVIDGAVSVNNFAYACKSLLLEHNITGDVILTDADGRVVYAADTELWSQQQHAFHTILQQNLTEGEVYHTVFYFTNITNVYSRLVFARQLIDPGGVYKGAVCIYLDCDGYIERLASDRYVGIVTLENGSVAGTNNRSLIQGNNKFPRARGLTYSTGEEQFWLSASALEDEGIRAYVLLHDFPLRMYLTLGILAILTILVLFLVLSIRFSKRLAAENSRSVQTLHRELDRLGSEARNSNMDHRVSLSSGDEFEEIAQHINALLDEVQEVNDKNMELVRLNGIMEVRQLEAQFNPHFLYNTLESIRCAAILGEPGIDDVILKLTELLRYSIDNTRQEVPVNEDLHYLTDYLEIIRYRFGARFSYQVDIEEDCRACLVTKLLLQPLVENSVKYGFAAKPTLYIHIRFFLEEGALIAEVADDGPGLSAEELERVRGYLTRSGGGRHRELQSIHRRLQLLYGGDSGVELFSQPGTGTKVRCRIRRGEER